MIFLLYVDLVPDAGIMVVSADDMKPPHDGCSRMWPPKVLHAVRIGRNEATGMVPCQIPY